MLPERFVVQPQHTSCFPTVWVIRDTRLGWTGFHTLNDQGIGAVEIFETEKAAQDHADELNREDAA